MSLLWMLMWSQKDICSLPCSFLLQCKTQFNIQNKVTSFLLLAIPTLLSTEIKSHSPYQFKHDMVKHIALHLGQIIRVPVHERECKRENVSETHPKLLKLARVRTKSMSAEHFGALYYAECAMQLVIYLSPRVWSSCLGLGLARLLHSKVSGANSPYQKLLGHLTLMRKCVKRLWEWR